mmetsp:Transcript_37607/g.80229  ORF Transcript_37607/g.80229 Transcript_37607/m.80229 type:complete len:555 (-) Transcript_37607:285-1949(-)|eukprot:CAMPEP_0172543552 /NCGR_PEP_ID=MMETSP1067-20121228/13907_1 /TAXON_ID=265564 ORGANISM="Thalassiosira punctigera, Strain Tpunct2005C2" /NCGR_SAMPLE_ID=MMETSP1067 /ASSEMBLY_ACC=CAM_ASM_000444 /LENGTH=554 /DNA_ID=CAMNT_0013329989 /DNA_START=67 /DNA_END=1731 /DNA_ORIENTATION=-
MDLSQQRADEKDIEGEGAGGAGPAKGDLLEHGNSGNNIAAGNDNISELKNDVASSVCDEYKRPPPNSNDGDKNGTNRNRPNKKRKKDGRGRKKYDDPRLNESTTVDDLSSVDAATYLAWVNRQADSLPDVFVSSVRDDGGKTQESDKEGKTLQLTPTALDGEGEPIDGSAATLQVMLSERMGILPPPSAKHLPPHSDSAPPSRHCWVSATVSNFSKLRAYLEREDAKRKRMRRHPSTDRNVAVPRMKDRAAWHVFCLGKEEAYGNAGGYYEEDGEEGEGDRNGKEDGEGRVGVAVEGEADDGEVQTHQQKWPSTTKNKEGAASITTQTPPPNQPSEQGVRSGNDNGGGVDAIEGKSTNGSSEIAQDRVGTQTQQTQLASTTNNIVKAANTQTSPHDETPKLIFDSAAVPENGYPPTTSLLLQLDQVLTRRLFHHQVHYLCEWKFPLTPARSRWVYALLARMEKPWHREECCAARSVLRECCERRRGLVLTGDDAPLPSHCGERVNETPTEGDPKAWEQLALLNTLIAITGIYYEQGAFAGGDGMDSLFTVVNES